MPDEYSIDWSESSNEIQWFFINHELAKPDEKKKMIKMLKKMVMNL